MGFHIGAKGAFALIVLCCAASICSVLAYQYYTKPNDTSPTPFSLRVVDKDGVVLDKNSFDATLYGLPVGKVLSPLNWEIVDVSITSLADIRTTDLDTAVHSRFYVRGCNGTVTQTTFVDTLGTRTYPVTEVEIFPNANNTITVYATPTTCELGLFDSTSMVALVINTTTVAGTNFTMVIGTNASQPDAAYHKYYSFSTASWICPNVLVTLNETVIETQCPVIGGWDRLLVDTTHVMYSCDEIGATPVVAFGEWPTDSIMASVFAERYGSTAI